MNRVAGVGWMGGWLGLNDVSKHGIEKIKNHSLLRPTHRFNPGKTKARAFIIQR